MEGQPIMEKPSDEEILSALAFYAGAGRPSYVIRNCLGRKRVTTPWVLRQLKRLEKAGKVERTSGPWAVMINWRTPLTKGTDHGE
jgi:hypothetical protein